MSRFHTLLDPIKLSALLAALLMSLGSVACSDDDDDDDDDTSNDDDDVTDDDDDDTTSDPCDGVEGNCIAIMPGASAEEDAQEALINAEDGDTIAFAAGDYDFANSLSVTNVPNLTIKGAGLDETVLSFKNQTTGAEGLFISNCDNISIEDIGMEDAKGDLIKIVGSDGVFMRRVRTEWTNGPDEANGAYGIYPVSSKDVLVEDSVANGASDTGIYVGQSSNIIIRNNRCEYNVAGIEIENSQDADVYDNHTMNNTAGVLVFNLPGLPVKDGRRTRVFNNHIADNNTPNFAPEGNIIGFVPAGTGILVMANDEVEVFGNHIENNETIGVAVVSFNVPEQLGGFQAEDPGFNYYPDTIYVHDNTYVNNGTDPQGDAGVVLGSLFLDLPLPNVVIDGFWDPEVVVDGEYPADKKICIQEEDLTFGSLNGDNNFVPVLFDAAPHDCTHDPLPAISIPGVE